MIGLLRRPRLLALALLLCAAPPAPAQEPAPADTVAPVAGEPLVRRLQRAPVIGDVMLLGEGTGYALTGPLRWDRDDLRFLGLAVAGVAAVSLLDEAGRDLMAANQSETNARIERWVEPFGATRGLKVLGGFYAAGLVLNDPKLRGVAVEGLATSLVASVLITPPLTSVFGRPRPRANRPAHTFREGGNSLPSGHTTQAFAVASVIATEYPHPAVQVGVYGLASAVGLSRMYRRSHFLSDVTAAALIGSTVGRTVARYGQRRRDRLRLAPVVSGEVTYLTVEARF